MLFRVNELSCLFGHPLFFTKRKTKQKTISKIKESLLIGENKPEIDGADHSVPLELIE